MNETWEYVLLFLLAAAPWLEVFLVVPLGIVRGLNPVAVSIIGFAGNWIPILLIGFFFTRITAWLRKRRLRKQTASSGIDSTLPQDDASLVSTKKTTKARRIWDRYGMPGFAIIAPAVIGTDIAALLALSFGSAKQRVMVWMTISLALWTILLAYCTYYGIELLFF